MMKKKKNKGFTMIELLATLVVLSIVIGITVITTGDTFAKAKRKSEGVFVKTLEDALDMYIDGPEIKKADDYEGCSCYINKTNGTSRLYKYITDEDGDGTPEKRITFKNNLIASNYTPLLESDMVNPANKEACSDAEIEIYRDDDSIYYYRVSKAALGCLLCNDNHKSDEKECDKLEKVVDKYITTLPESVVEELDNNKCTCD